MVNYWYHHSSTKNIIRYWLFKIFAKLIKKNLRTSQTVEKKMYAAICYTAIDCNNNNVNVLYKSIAISNGVD